MERVTHAFTVDVEEWYHPLRFYMDTAPVAVPRLRVGLDHLTELLAERDTPATFFWVGDTAVAHRDEVRRQAEAGHEIGCHSFSHDRMVYDLTPGRFREETARALETLAEITGRPVRSYRAPCFSITARSLWALDVLAELGVEVDSSIFPVRNWRYGIPGYARVPVAATPDGRLWEAPLSVRTLGRANIPATGGAYFRIYPYALTAANLRAAERRGEPVIFYIHPWELDPGHPFVPFRWKPCLTHYAALGRTVPRLRRLLRDFRFGTLGGVVGPWRARGRGRGAAAASAPST